MFRSILAGSRTRLTQSTRVPIRHFRTTPRCFNDKNDSGSLFGEVTKPSSSSTLEQISSRAQSAGDGQAGLPKSDEQLANDPEVLQHTEPAALDAPRLLLSPLKRRLYNLAMEQGGYDPNRVLELDGKKYQLKLTREELQALEPSVYLRSYRIKGSTKKATPFLRMLREMDLKQALTQCHFSSKRMARDVGEMLNRGVKESQALKLNPDDLYISQIWVGKDGGNYKRLDFKARGKVGIIEHKWIHVRAILKTKESKQKFLEQKRARELARPVKQPLTSKPIHVDHPVMAYKW